MLITNNIKAVFVDSKLNGKEQKTEDKNKEQEEKQKENKEIKTPTIYQEFPLKLQSLHLLLIMS